MITRDGPPPGGTISSRNASKSGRSEVGASRFISTSFPSTVLAVLLLLSFVNCDGGTAEGDVRVQVKVRTGVVDGEINTGGKYSSNGDKPPDMARPAAKKKKRTVRVAVAGPDPAVPGSQTHIEDRVVDDGHND